MTWVFLAMHTVTGTVANLGVGDLGVSGNVHRVRDCCELSG